MKAFGMRVAGRPSGYWCGSGEPLDGFLNPRFRAYSLFLRTGAVPTEALSRDNYYWVSEPPKCKSK